MTWEVNARLFFTSKYEMEPEVSTYYGSFPEDSAPTHIVYDMRISGNEDYGIEEIKAFIVIEITSNSMIIREADEGEKELLEQGRALVLEAAQEEDSD